MAYAFDPELAPFVEAIPLADIGDLAKARANLLALIEPLNSDVDTSGLRITDHRVPGPEGAPPVLVRVYEPDSPAPAGGRPALLDIHGGGFVLGDISMQHGVAAILARRLDAVVATVEYRLAPEHPFPAGVEDCYAALRWMHGEASSLGIDTTRVAVGGQSAGGGLAAAVALLARDRGGPPLCFQLLGIPELDHRLETTSMRTFVDTPMWNRPNAVLSWRYYLGPDPGEVSPYASPAIAEDLHGLPPAYVTAMEFDPLRDEGILYALRLMEAGVPVELHTFPGTFHGSGAMVWAGVSRRGAEEHQEVLRRALRVE
ncbi:MAG TPA: alpha/beta hydrolase [Acidimicrobiia bacterium]|nr:alpha/beta hydrolase [Acidimicrobiia bacterium]